MKIRKNPPSTNQHPKSSFGSPVPKSSFGSSHKLFTDIKRPAFADTLKFPDDITELDASNLSDLMGKYTLLYSYANQKRADTTRELMLAETRLSRIKNGIFLKRPTINQQERWKRDSIIEADEETQDQVDKITVLKTVKATLEMYCDNFERYTQVLSRELSRKMSGTPYH